MKWSPLLLFAALLPASASGKRASFGLDANGLDQLMKSKKPAFVVFHPKGCSSMCKELVPMWRELGKNLMDFNIVFGAMDCDLAPAACAARKIADGPSPVLKYWTGETFRRYSGAFKLRSLQEYSFDERRLHRASPLQERILIR